MSLLFTGVFAGLAAVGGGITASNFYNGYNVLGRVTSLATAFFVAATVLNASDVNEIEDQFEPYETLIEQGEFDAENAHSLCNRMQKDIQKGFEEYGGEGKFIISCDLTPKP